MMKGNKNNVAVMILLCVAFACSSCKQKHPDNAVAQKQTHQKVQSPVSANAQEKEFFLGYNYLTYLNDQSVESYTDTRHLKMWKKGINRASMKEPWELKCLLDYPTGQNVCDRKIRQWLSKRIWWCVKYSFIGQNDELNGVKFQEISAENLTGQQLCDAYFKYIQVFVNSFSDKDIADWNESSTNVPSATVIFSKVYETDKICTYFCRLCAYSGGAHGEHMCEFATFDKKTGRQLDCSDIINSDCYEELSMMLADAWKKQKSEEERLETANSVNGMKYKVAEDDGKLMVDTNVGIIKQGIIFVYDTYLLGSYADGCFMFLLPRDKAAKYCRLTE